MKPMQTALIKLGCRPSADGAFPVLFDENTGRAIFIGVEGVSDWLEDPQELGDLIVEGLADYEPLVQLVLDEDDPDASGT